MDGRILRGEYVIEMKNIINSSRLRVNLQLRNIQPAPPEEGRQFSAGQRGFGREAKVQNKASVRINSVKANVITRPV
ncbi:MAG: hypothetical protein ACYDEQ_04125 [Desulfocucumaceae bacterium]